MPRKIARENQFLKDENTKYGIILEIKCLVF